MKNEWIRYEGRVKRQKRARLTISGTPEKPRLSVYRSLNHLYAQLIDDLNGKTLLSLSTVSPELKDKVKNNAGNVKGASILGEAVAELCKKNNVSKVVFDKAGNAYHGRVKALAEAARKGGLKF